MHLDEESATDDGQETSSIVKEQLTNVASVSSVTDSGLCETTTSIESLRVEKANTMSEQEKSVSPVLTGTSLGNTGEKLIGKNVFYSWNNH